MSKSGKCRVEVGITLNMGNYNSIKSTVSFEETYTGEGDDTREAKFNELLDVCNEKVDIAVGSIAAIVKGQHE